VRVPFADVGPMKIPDDMSDEDVLLLTDVFPTGYQAAEMGSIAEGDPAFGGGVIRPRKEQRSMATRTEPADRRPSSRPGVPMYGRAGARAAITRPPLDQQRAEVPVLIGVDVGRLTPVFGTMQPPRGLSGLIRRAGYRIPEHKAGRWMLLLLGDRVDVWESRLRRRRWLVLGAAAAGVLLWRRRAA